MKRIGHYVINIIFIFLATYIILMRVHPEMVKDIIGYQSFVILTDSMEPLIPTGSAVLVKNFKENEEPEKNTIISFNVDRLGTPAVFTHYFRETEVEEDGRIRYRTQGATADRYDDYYTYREDLIGTYVFHIPYVGKFILFLQSPFALLELGIILFIMLINRILWEKFDREEKEALAAAEAENIEDSAEDSDIETEDDSEYLKSVDVEEISEDMEEVQPDGANTDIREEE